MQARMRIGIDIGGTFTDFVVYSPGAGRLETFKLRSTQHNPAEAVLTGLAQVMAASTPLDVIHGSTVATNALLERKGAPIAFITTRGFKDILQIGRQNRPALYDWFADPPAALAPAHLRYEVDERIGPGGEVIQALDENGLSPVLADIRAAGITSVAVCLLFSFANPRHEQQIGQLLRSGGLNASLSSEILPEFREYERASTTAVNAYVTPVLDRYLGYLESTFSGAALDSKPDILLRVMQSNGGAALDSKPDILLRVMQSNGGHISLGEARKYGVRCVLSGPAGGIVGATHMARLAASALSAGQTPVASGLPVRIITFDMGGTSTDVSLVDGAPRLNTESQVSGCPIHIPMLDIHTIGAGGGSLAYIDLGGALRVGPESAGADPGPACYGASLQPTVTDANLVLGRLAPDHFLGEQIQLSPERSFEALKRLGQPLGLSPVQAALGVVEIVNAHMERALRLISVERGHDPGDFTLVSFGGAGGLHAAGLARRLGIPRLLISPFASTLSAFGMLAADVVKDYSQTVMLPGSTALETLASMLEPLVERGRQELLLEGIPPGDIEIEKLLDMRYAGQSYELRLAWPARTDPLAAFHSLHQGAYGYSRPGAAVEIVNLRLRATGKVAPPILQPAPLAGSQPDSALLEHRPVVIEDGQAHLTPFYQYEKLQPGNQLQGPAIILRSDTSILLGIHDQARVDPFYNLIFEMR